LLLEWVPILKDWRLNERNYGTLVGRNKKQCVEEYGKDQVKRWRRSWDEPPPPMSKDFKYWPGKDPRYEVLGIDIDQIPLAESLKDVTVRTSKFWDEVSGIGQSSSLHTYYISEVFGMFVYKDKKIKVNQSSINEVYVLNCRKKSLLLLESDDYSMANSLTSFLLRKYCRI